MKFILLLVLLTSCGIDEPEYSPWQSSPSSRGLTAQHLGWLRGIEGSTKDLKLAIVGDPQAVPGSLKTTITILNHDPTIDFIVITGDITDRGLLKEFEWISEIIDTSNKPILTVVGNHDGLNNGEDIYTKMFGPLNYSFTFRDITFVMWNNNYYEWGVPDFSWLRRQVASNEKVVVVSHQPPNSGTLKKGHEEQWKSIRQEPNMMASIHGHVHHYNFEVEGSLPVYTVDRVTNIHYGLMTIEDHVMRFFNCTPLCSEVQYGSNDNSNLFIRTSQ